MTSPKRPFAPVHVSTDAFPQRQRLAMWREVYGRNIANVDIEPIDDRPFHADVTFLPLPGIGIASGSRSAAHYRITRQHLAHAKDVRAKDAVGLSMLTSGAATTAQLGTEIVSQPGNAVVLSGTDPSVSTMHRLGSFVTIVFPRSELSTLVPDLGAAYTRPIAAGNEALRLLVRYIKTLRQGGPFDVPGLAQSAATHITDLAALAIGAKADAAHQAQQRGVAAARLQAIKTEIGDNLGNHDLSVAMMAARYGVTPRYVHKLFEREGTTFSAFVLKHRLARARKMLGHPRFVAHTISAIAFECGFSDLSHFNRAFRRAYNATPSEIRHAALGARYG